MSHCFGGIKNNKKGIGRRVHSISRPIKKQSTNADGGYKLGIGTYTADLHAKSAVFMLRWNSGRNRHQIKQARNQKPATKAKFELFPLDKSEAGSRMGFPKCWFCKVRRFLLEYFSKREAWNLGRSLWNIFFFLLNWPPADVPTYLCIIYRFGPVERENIP